MCLILANERYALAHRPRGPSVTLQKPKSDSHKEKCRENGLKGAQKIGAARKGKTAEEIYGLEKARAMVEKRLATLAKNRATEVAFNL